MIEVEPQPRIDTLVRLPGGGDARRTDYTGTASFFVPDCLPYNRASLGDATLTVSVVLQASDETGVIWIQVHVDGHRSCRPASGTASSR
jgi:hypothetical protein